MPCIELYAKRLERKATHIVFLHAAYYTINPQPGNEGAKSIYCFLGRDGDIPSLFGMGTWADVYGCSTLPPPCLGRSPPSLITKWSSFGNESVILILYTVCRYEEGIVDSCSSAYRRDARCARLRAERGALRGDFREHGADRRLVCPELYVQGRLPAVRGEATVRVPGIGALVQGARRERVRGASSVARLLACASRNPVLVGAQDIVARRGDACGGALRDDRCT